MFLEDPFYDSKSRRTGDGPLKWKLAHHDVRHHFEAALYHFGRMLHGNSLGNFKVVIFEYDALVWSLYSVRDHLAQELNIFFCLGIEERAFNIYDQVKEELQRQSKDTATDIVRLLDKLANAKWFESLKERRHTITHRTSKPDVLASSLSWENQPPHELLNLNSIEIYGDDLYRKAMRKFKHEWLATSWITIELFKKQIETIWFLMSRISD